MKKVILALALILSCSSTFAKKIKFSVDMGTHTISPAGVYLMGDFQAYLGLPLGDWQPNTLKLRQVGTSTVYDTILDLPAFVKYEFLYLSGDQGYEVEFVPDPSRVGYSFNGNRWLYLDSLANDTTFVGVIPFSGNAPAGKTLIRFLVDMSSVGTISPNGVHVAGTFQSSAWNPVNNILYSFGAGVYEVIAYAISGNYQFKYYNGKTLGNTETVPGGCATAGNRTHNLTNDTILPTVCFNACVTCALAGINEQAGEITGIKMYPNPANHFSVMEFKNKGVSYNVAIMDLTGRFLKTYSSVNGENITIKKDELSAGLYFVNVIDSKNAKASSKLIIE